MVFQNKFIHFDDDSFHNSYVNKIIYYSTFIYVSYISFLYINLSFPFYLIIIIYIIIHIIIIVLIIITIIILIILIILLHPLPNFFNHEAFYSINYYIIQPLV